jgi:hypothetical protein
LVLLDIENNLCDIIITDGVACVSQMGRQWVIYWYIATTVGKRWTLVFSLFGVQCNMPRG